MLLYLCTDDPDLRPHVVAGLGAKRAGPGQARAVEAGWRLGTALRSARARYESVPGGPTGRQVVPHLRRAHWHHYWTGPMSSPQGRRLVLRYLFPVQVGKALPGTTVVRPAAIGEESDA